MRHLSVIALGGNALIRSGEAGTFEQQRAHIEESMAPIAGVAAAGLPLILTHGNGPTVGQLLLQAELAKGEVPPMPLHVMDAESQGSLGFLLVQALTNHLRRAGVRREAVAMVTRVVVAADDPSFAQPTKPVGAFYTQEQAQKLQRERGWVVGEDAGRGYRRRVASPQPLQILEAGLVGRLAAAGVIVVAAGGGGIPVVRRDDGTSEGVDAVVDKDRASALLALEAGAQRLLILTSVDAVYADFGAPGQHALPELGLERAALLLKEGQFPPGSMGPKIEAAVTFLRGGGREVRIGLPEHLREILAGRAGTLLRREERREARR